MVYHYSAGLAQSEYQPIPQTVDEQVRTITDHAPKTQHGDVGKKLSIVGILFLVTMIIFNFVSPQKISGTISPHMEIFVEINDRGAAQSNCEMPDDVIYTAFKTQKTAEIAFYIGAICRWRLENDWSEIEVTYSWFEHGTVDREKKVDKELGFNVTDSSFQSRPALIVKVPDGCGFVTENPDRSYGGVIQFWVQSGPSEGSKEDYCRVTQDLMRFAYGERA